MVALSMVVAVGGPAQVPTAHAATGSLACPAGSEWTLRDLVNSYRQANGRSALPLSAELMAKAQAWSEHMATTGSLTHSNLSSGVSGGWTYISENIAYNSSSVAAAQAALQASAPHRANMLSTSSTEMGVGVAQDANGWYWVTEVFAGRHTPTPAYVAPSGTSAFDTVTPTVVFNPGRVNGGTTSTFQVAGVGGVPAGATAAVVTIEAWNPASRGWIQGLGPGATVASSSNLNLTSGAAANTAVVPLATNGTMRLYNSMAVNLKVTVTGYFTEVTGCVAAGRFVPVVPSRILDTRPAYLNGYSGSKPGAGSTVTVQVGGKAGVPATGVRAVVLNVTAVMPNGAGDVQAGQYGMAAGAWRNLVVSRPGQVIANLVIVPVDAQGRAALRTTVGTHLVVDVEGWFTTSSATPSRSGLFVPVTPARFLDTRYSTGPVQAVTNVPVAGEHSMPACPRAVLGNLTVIPTQSTTFVQIGPSNQFSGGSYSNINNDIVGEPIANAALVITGQGWDVDTWSWTPTQVIVDIAGWFT
ncbi:MAG: CAP domain-containing protein [Acidimicrobiaceae bacterium]|nr:CAP domain-containing protein [Ilumatobacter sp.]MCB9380670.1 CAP domain-containing protein [Acidimicrobiaceae bacterium]MCO5329156.1 CAP domain-containing protein [Ilumatobacteraceae bacterium]